MTTHIAAAIQMVSSADRDQNLAQCAALLAQAADGGAELAVLPENFAYMGARESDKLAIAEDSGNGVIQDFLAEQAAKHKLWVVGGTLPIKGDAQHVYARCQVNNARGEYVGHYDKIHLFDVHLPATENNQGEHYRESASIFAGEQPVVLETPFGRLGLSVCYDLRFPELYRALVAQGAQLFTVASAFTAATGRAHWEPLIRARAIENLCYVIAPNQGGKHASQRETYGDSMLVNPWGQILDRLPHGAGVALGEIDTEQLQRTREHFPCLNHRRL